MIRVKTIDCYDEVNELKTSDEWFKLVGNHYNVERILDPDGWDRANWEYSYFEEKINLLEFEKRLGMSTCLFMRSSK